VPVPEVFISVLMITYNSSKFLNEAIDSVLKLDYNNFELVISDDNSTDNSWEIIKSFTDDRIKATRNAKNLGEYGNRNKAIENACGAYVIFIDGDDIIYDYCLQILASFSEKYPVCGMILARPWDERIIYPLQITPKQFYCFEYLDNGITGINFTKILFKKEALLSVKSFDNCNIRMGDDYIQYKIGALYPSLIIQDGFSWWRRRSGQASENLIKNNYLFMLDKLQYKIDALNNAKKLFNPEEFQQAKINFYGGILRSIIREVFRLKIKNAANVLIQYPVLKQYISSAFKKPMTNYFGNYSGDNPMREIK
jgi:glycosyltransferase involved in cell wall biosynthesis